VDRHPVLKDLSRDHHYLLLHAQRLQQAVATGPQEALAASRQFLEYWSNAGTDHFEEEMRYVVPLTPEGSLQGRYNMIEEALRGAVDQLRITLMDPQFFRASIQQLIPLLRAHINFCEATLFEDVEDNMSEEDFAKVGAQMAAFRKQRRPEGIGLNRTEKSYIANAPKPPA
jgi:hypothetical protein